MKKQKAFTLTELLIVITIILMLINLIMPAVMSAVALADRIACNSNLRQIGIAGILFLAKEQYFPGEWWATGLASGGTRWPIKFLPYLKENRDVFWCPLSPDVLKWDDGRLEPGKSNFSWVPHFSYGLNTRGSFVGTNQNIGGWWTPVGASKQGIYPSEIALAANFIWIADSNDGDSEDPWCANGIEIDVTFGAVTSGHPPHKVWPGKRHSGGANFH
ncbi:MAG: type II secretion system protein, partial [Planctomycetia bacterium]|nr:type II secretion system protein [Planctomycetia bacterium]